jgi:hypothetical protein
MERTMPPYKLERLGDEPIMLVTIEIDYSIARDMQQSDAEGRVLADASEQPLFWITDISKLKPSIDDLLLGSNQGARGEDPLWHHPMIREMIFVSSSPLIQLAAKGMNSVTFGNLNVQVFKSVGDALDYCRSKVSANGSGGLD